MKPPLRRRLRSRPRCLAQVFAAPVDGVWNHRHPDRLQLPGAVPAVAGIAPSQRQPPAAPAGQHA